MAVRQGCFGAGFPSQALRLDRDEDVMGRIYTGNLSHARDGGILEGILVFYRK